MHACGLTVYARGHIGNFRTFVALDVLRRALEVNGYEVRQVRNYTDVDDRTIVESIKAGRPLREYTQQFVDAFELDAAALGLEPSNTAPRATDHIPAMAGMIHALEQNGHTYASDGSIYFKISTFPEYGKLARLDHGGIKSGARVDSDSDEKEDARDFVLWKASKAGEPSWEPDLPPGRPGWHIECSAMAAELLGELPIDIHGGGVDLIFPHHENEIAQAEGATKRQFSRFWVHVEHLHDRGGAPERREDVQVARQRLQPRRRRRAGLPAVGVALSVSRHPLPQAAEVLLGAAGAVGRIAQADHRPRWRGSTRCRAGHANGATATRLQEAASAFAEQIRADLNTAGALGIVFELVRALNSSIDAGELHGERRAWRCAPRSTGSIACSACCRCAAPKTSARRCRSRRSTSSSRRAAPRAPRATSRKRIEFEGPRRARHPPRRHRRRNPLEEKNKLEAGS